MSEKERTELIAQARREVASAGRELIRLGLAARTWGNVSDRISAHEYAITPSGLDYERITENDIALCRLGDKGYEGARKPSSELRIHESAYLAFGDAGFVIHTHQKNASAIGVAGYAAFERALSERDKSFLGGVGLAEYGLPGTKTLNGNVAREFEKGAHTVLMKSHGAVIVGRDREEAFVRAARLEALAGEALRGQPAGAGKAEVNDGFISEVCSLMPGAEHVASPAVLALSAISSPIYAQLDDMAQMTGIHLNSAEPSASAIAEALRKRGAVLVANCGAFVAGADAGDTAALALLLEKAAVTYLNSLACIKEEGREKPPRISLLDAHLMRLVYKYKYSKRKES